MKRSRENAASSSGSSSGHALQVFASGLPYDLSEEALLAFFSPCGAVASMKVPRFQDTGRLRGFAHITFSSAEAVEAALALSGKYLGERFVTVEAAKPEQAARAPTRQPSGCSTLFVRNLPYEADEGVVQAAFEKFGKVASVRIPRRTDTRASKGFGYVQFETPQAAQAAVTFASAPDSRLLVAERPVKLDYDTGAPKASFRAPDGRYALHLGSGGPEQEGRPRGGAPGKRKLVDAGAAWAAEK
jgi:nucleolin